MSLDPWQAAYLIERREASLKRAMELYPGNTFLQNAYLCGAFRELLQQASDTIASLERRLLESYRMHPEGCECGPHCDYRPEAENSVEEVRGL